MNSRASVLRPRDTSSIGWISTADMFLFATLLFLLAAVFLDAKLSKVPKDVTDVVAALDEREQRINDLIKQLADVERQRKELEEKLNLEVAKNGALTKEVADLKERLARSEKTIAALTAELAETKKLVASLQASLKDQAELERENKRLKTLTVVQQEKYLTS